jgi:hypothetical protein
MGILSANSDQTVGARHYLARRTDGLAHDWPDQVFLKPPYGKMDNRQSRQQLWREKLLRQYEKGVATEAIPLVNAATGTLWFWRLWKAMPLGRPVCFTRRTEFRSPGGHFRQPANGNVFMYFGRNPRRFIEVFAPPGVVVARIVSD